MTTFEEAYKKAVKENGCNAGETFAKSMFRAGADNLMSQGVKLGIKKYHQGMDYMKQKAIEAYKKSCDFNAPGCCGCKSSKGECNCEQLKDFITELENN